MSLQTAISELISLTEGKTCSDLVLRKIQEVSDALGNEIVEPVEVVVASTEVIEAIAASKAEAPVEVDVV